MGGKVNMEVSTEMWSVLYFAHFDCRVRPRAERGVSLGLGRIDLTFTLDLEQGFNSVAINSEKY